MNIENDIQVSVCVVTYNQESYIAECLESLVTQQTSFKFEIIVGEDCSKDTTRAIVQQYAEKYPGLIIPLFYEKNIGPVENIKQVYKKAKGKYIAHMDGDDLALPNKLQKQFDILEKNLDCVICAHNMILINELGVELNIKNSFNQKQRKIDWKEYIKKTSVFAHSSKFFLKDTLLKKLESSRLSQNTLDFELHLESLKKGKIIYITDQLGKYRQLAGVSSNKDIYIVFNRGFFRMFEECLIFFEDKFYIKKIIIYFFILRILSALKRGDVAEVYIIFCCVIKLMKINSVAKSNDKL